MSSVFTPSPAELALVSQIFAQADPQKLGVITGEVAVRVFGGAKLPTAVLNEIWTIADEDNKGWLSRKGVAVAVRLMGWAQKGEKVTSALVNKPGPIPTIEGITAFAPQNTGLSSSRSPPPGLPPLTAQDKAKFQRMFLGSGPVNGLLSGEKARDIFVKSKLPVEKLLQIWNLADTRDRGSLDAAEFAIGMYLIQASMSGTLQTIPSALPPGLYEQAGGSAPSAPGSVISHTTGTSGSFPAGGRAIQSQYTGQSPLLQQNTGQRLNAAAPRLPQRPASSAWGSSAFESPPANGHTIPWDVTATEKLSSDRFFEGLDSQKRGFIEGDVAVPFMLESKLSEDDLALVWDLADVDGDGRLTRDEFAVAMHLIHAKLGGKDIPAVIPPSLIPPSMRSNATAPALQQKAPELPKDLFSWDETPPPSATAPQHTGGAFATLQPQSTGQQLSAFSSPAAPRPTYEPFGHAIPAQGSGYTSPAPAHDLLGDDHDAGTTSPPLHDQSAEIGNVQNQLNSTNRSLETTKAERAAIEQTLANQAGQLSALQTQLSSAKAAYETETKLLATLRERQASQSADIQKTREELIRAESDLSAIRVEKAETEGTFLRDKEEARNLHKKMVETGQHAETLKAEVEKLKKDAKQQKGLLAIARKQLSTKEAERAKIEKERDEVASEVADVTKEREEAEAEIIKEAPVTSSASPERSQSPDSVAFAAAHALPTSPDPVSPSTTSSLLGKSNNPFERLTSTTSPSRSQSPFLPFTQSSLPTSPFAPSALETAPGVTGSDPFGFDPPEQASPDPAATSQDAGPSPDTNLFNQGAATPKPVSVHDLPARPVSTEIATSPTSGSGSDHFATPPTTATLLPHEVSPALKDPTPTVDEASAHFPPISAVASDNHKTETDLGTQLKELELESDSDTDSDDEVPLAELNKGKGVDKSSQQQSSSNGTATNGASFDDIFGVDQPANATPTATHTNTTTKSSPFDLPSSAPASKLATQAVAGVSEFDEAMGKIPTTTATSAAPAFSFDSAFEDSFDFASSTDKSFPPPPTSVNGSSTSPKAASNNNDGFDSIFTVPSKTPTSATNGNFPTPAPQNAAQKAPLSFDDVFTTESSSQPPANGTTSLPPQNSSFGVSFDEAFSGMEPSQVLQLDQSFASEAPEPSPHASITESPAHKPTPAPAPLVPNSPLASPASVRTSSYGRSTSPPPRHRSPPPRVSSPRSRPSTSSTSSSNNGQEKLQPPPTRHSKLSIRLPFGKKKKQEAAAAAAAAVGASQSQLSPALEEPAGAQTPAVDDDVEAVKQLCGMGFSRTQAILALERHGYDVQKALNSLLGQ